MVPGPPCVTMALSWKGTHGRSSRSISAPLLGVHSTLDSIRHNLPFPKHSRQLCHLVFEHLLESFRSEIYFSSIVPSTLGLAQMPRFWEVFKRTLPPKQKQVLPLTGRMPLSPLQETSSLRAEAKSLGPVRVDTQKRTNNTFMVDGPPHNTGWSAVAATVWVGVGGSPGASHKGCIHSL